MIINSHNNFNINIGADNTAYPFLSFKAAKKNRTNPYKDSFETEIKKIQRQVQKSKNNPKIAEVVAAASAILTSLFQTKQLKRKSVINPAEVLSRYFKLHGIKIDSVKELNKMVSTVTANDTKLNHNADKLTRTELKMLLTVMSANGFTQKKMGMLLGKSQSTVNYYIKKFGLRKIKEQNLQNDLRNFILNKPERTENLQVLKNYQNISAQYKQMLTEHILNKSNKINEELLESFEELMRVIPEKDQPYNKYLYMLDKKYSDSLDIICKAFNANRNGNGSDAGFRNWITNENVVLSDFERLRDYEAIDCDGYNLLTQLDQKTANKIIERKKYFRSLNVIQLQKTADLEENSVKIFDEMRRTKQIKTFFINRMNDGDNYVFSLLFYDGTTDIEKLFKVSQFYKALYGNIKSKNNPNEEKLKISKKLFCAKLLKVLEQDILLESVYNVAKYIAPASMKKYNLSTAEVLNLDRNSSLYRNLKFDLKYTLKHVQKDGTRIIEMIDALNNKELYGGLMENQHAIFRFLSRFVLRIDSPGAKQEFNVKQKSDMLMKDIHEQLKKTFNIFPHIPMSKSTEQLAPSFFLKNTKLGEYIKVALNDKGKIHTIFETAKFDPAGKLHNYPDV